ncbi:MAG: hydrogen gas-evolving membrane-bound hydrogenase subunit E [Opitutales bacterium]|jgi:multicomponent Na+:H+ antiporter subunit B
MAKPAAIIVALIGALLLYAATDFPTWGDPASPASASPVSSHFVAETGVDTEVPNMVTAVLADYRGFDTMFETVVIFIAGIAIIAILRRTGADAEKPSRKKESDVSTKPDLIVTHTVRLLVPVIQLFAFYVLAHGHVSPGGGFQGGVIMGASFILVALAWDLPTAMDRLSVDRAVLLAGVGILIYAGIGLLSMVLGGEFLDYAELSRILPVSREMARYHAMLGVEIGVAFTVTTVMFAIYANLSTRGRLEGGL